MKILLTIVGLFILFLKLQAQGDTSIAGNCLKNTICNYDLYCDKNDASTLPGIFSTIVTTIPKSYAKNTNPTGYPGDVKYDNENNGVGSDNFLGDTVKYCYPGTEELTYVAYYPKPYNPQTQTGYNYSQCPLPVYVNVHGGGFSDCRDNSESAGDNVLCDAMARRGFMVFNVNYRLGVILAQNVITAQQQLAIYRASQDIRGLIRSIIRLQQDQDNGVNGAPPTPYKINTNYIFLGGNSAGSATALNVAYYPTQNKISQVNPHGGTSTMVDALGPIEADYYYGGTNIDYRSSIKGVLDQWGSVEIPSSYTQANAKDFFGNVRIPVICFHGSLDKTVKIGITPVNFATSNDNDLNTTPPFIVNSESSCVESGVTFQTDNSTTNNPDLYEYGSKAFFTYVLQSLDIPSELYIDCQMGHGLDKQDGPNFDSDFGTGYHTADQVSTYIAARTAVFFQSIIKQKCPGKAGCNHACYS